MPFLPVQQRALLGQPEEAEEGSCRAAAAGFLSGLNSAGVFRINQVKSSLAVKTTLKFQSEPRPD